MRIFKAKSVKNVIICNPVRSNDIYIIDFLEISQNDYKFLSYNFFIILSFSNFVFCYYSNYMFRNKIARIIESGTEIQLFSK